MNCDANIEISIGDPVDPLVITSVKSESSIQWAELVLPEWSFRMVYAAPTGFVPGNVLLSAVEDSADLALLVNLQAASASGLEAQKALLKNALAVWPGEVTLTLVEDGGDTIIGGPWQSFPTAPRWGSVRALLSGDYFQDALVSIPVNPAGAP